MAFKFYSSIVAQTATIVDRGNIKQWSCNNTAISGKVLLQGYTGSDWSNIIYVPIFGNKTLVNWNINGYNIFSNKLQRIDFQYVPFKDNKMYATFTECYNLREVYNLNPNITNMRHAFDRCYNLKYNVKIPKKVVNMYTTFQSCYNLNHNIQIPNSVTDMTLAFSSCVNFNQSIQIPRSVTNLSYTFRWCYNLKTRINVLSTEITSGSFNTFDGTSNAKQVYIYYKYANGVYTKTYNAVVLGNNGSTTNNLYKWQGRNGVTVKDLGTAPW